MKINDRGLNLIKFYEGLKLKSYQDDGGVWTIGFGSTRRVGPGMVITADQALERLSQDLEEKEKLVESMVKVPLTSNEFSALVSFAYNVKEKEFITSSLVKLLNEGKKDLAAHEFLRWDHCDGKAIQGLLNRRLAERALFLYPDAGDK